MLNLPNVTLVMVETIEHELARLAMEDCLSQIHFGDVLLLTDKPNLFEGIKTRVQVVPNWPSKLEWCQANWFVVPPLIATSHIMFCQWDAGIWNVGAWEDKFLDYDFIGSVWQWLPSMRVG